MSRQVRRRTHQSASSLDGSTALVTDPFLAPCLRSIRLAEAVLTIWLLINTPALGDQGH